MKFYTFDLILKFFKDSLPMLVTFFKSRAHLSKDLAINSIGKVPLPLPTLPSPPLPRNFFATCPQIYSSTSESCIFDGSDLTVFGQSQLLMLFYKLEIQRTQNHICQNELGEGALYYVVLSLLSHPIEPLTVR